MPRVHDSSPPEAGPGSVFTQLPGVNSKRPRRIKRKNVRRAILDNDDDDMELLFSFSSNPVHPPKTTVKQHKSIVDSESEDVDISEPAANCRMQEKEGDESTITMPAEPKASAAPKKTINKEVNKNTSNPEPPRATTTKPLPASKKTKTKKKKQAPGSPSLKHSRRVSFTPPLTPKRSNSRMTSASHLQKQAPPSTATTTIARAPLLTASVSMSPSTLLPMMGTKSARHKNKCAIAFDTRFLATTEGQHAGQEFLKASQAFLHSLTVRGANPCVVATSVSREKSLASTAAASKKQLASARPKKHFVAAQARILKDESFSLEPVWIAPPSSMQENSSLINHEHHSKAAPVPKLLLANDSWKHLGGLVEAIAQLHQTTGNAKTEHAAKRPRVVRRGHALDITLCTSDVSLFVDTNEGSHKRAIARFWEQVKPLFQESLVRVVQICVIMTGTVAMAEPLGQEEWIPFTRISDDHDGQHVGDAMDDDEKKARASNMHAISVSNCIRALQSQLKVRADADFKINRSVLDPIPPVDVTLSVLDAASGPRLAFQSLARRCMRDVLVATAAAVRSNTTSGINIAKQNRIKLELPETVDGTQCSVHLDLQYKTTPFRLDNVGFFEDLNALTESTLVVVQLAPLDSIDASLLYGVPMSVRVGLEDDLEQYREMTTLVGALFSYLRAKQVAIVLRSQSRDSKTELDQTETSFNEQQTKNNDNSSHVFHNSGMDQMFLLMAEEGVARQASKAQAPLTGILFRYSSADEMILEHELAPTKEDLTICEETAEQYESYVESALDCLEVNTVNPLFLDATMSFGMTTSPTPSSNADGEDDDDKRWNDDTGVGSLVAARAAINGDGEEEDKSDSPLDVDDDNDTYFHFEY